uniref:Uncharacterized protein n=1 Tax=Bartonella rochalimae ATCC BAA-1498 TaxID=685782 RepID=E6YLY0_9HYPH|nr:hypothetical protein BARRO_50231 [Bartonella rochalimae ATCC BAA-1498]
MYNKLKIFDTNVINNQLVFKIKYYYGFIIAFNLCVQRYNSNFAIFY